MTAQTSPLASAYQLIGGPAAIRALVNRFYDLVDTEPRAAALRQMHLNGHGLAHAREAQTDFLTGFLGGPQLYFERNRHQDVRAIHAHLAIDRDARDAWLYCMDKALKEEGVDEALQARMMSAFTRVATMLVNAG